MATSVNFSRFFAALAAVLTFLLTACGGGEEMAQAPVPPFQATQAVKSDALAQGVQTRSRVLAVEGGEKSGFQVAFTATPLPKKVTAKAVSAALIFPAEFSNAVLIDWAQTVYPDLFPGTPVIYEDVLAPDNNRYYARYYAATQNYVGICLDVPSNKCEKNGAYGLGPYTGNAMAYFGHRDTFKCLIEDAKYCRLQFLSSLPVDAAVNVSPKGTSAVFKWKEAINCAGIGGTGPVGNDIKVMVTITCDSAQGAITITPQENRWPFNAENCFTLTGITSSTDTLRQYPSYPVQTCFSTRAVQSARTVYVGDNGTAISSSKAWALNLVNPVSGTITKQIAFPTDIALRGVHNFIADPLSGQLVLIPWGAYRLYFVDLEDHGVTYLNLNPTPSVEYITEGMFLSGANFCTAFTRSFTFPGGKPQLQSNNQIACWDRMTKGLSLATAKNSLAEEAMRTFRIQMIPQPAAKLYLVNGLHTAYDNGDGLWYPNTPGELRVLHPTTFALERKVSVGSVPVDFAVHSTSGDVYVVNGGDKSLSIVRPNNSVETVKLVGFDERGDQRPTSILLDEPKNRFYIADGYRNVFVYDLTTRQEVRRIPISPEYGPIYLARVGNEIYVTNAHYQGGSVSVINRDTLTVTRVISGLGDFPKGIVEFASP